MKKLIAITSATLLALSLTACGGGDSADTGSSSTTSNTTSNNDSAPKAAPKAVDKSKASGFAGTWQVDKESMKTIMMDAMMAEMPADAPQEQKDMMIGMAESMLESMTVTLAVNEDKTFNVSMQMMGNAEDANGTWSVADGVITMTEDGEEGPPATGKIEDGKLVLDFPAEDGGPQQMIMIRG